MTTVSDQSVKPGNTPGSEHGFSHTGTRMAESISALMDGEVSEMELHRVLGAADSDKGVRGTWQRYHLVSASIRNNMAAGPLVDLSSAIRQAIEEETQAPQRRGWRNTSIKLAMAASVAAVMVFTTQLAGLQSGMPTSNNPEAAVVASAGQGRTISAPPVSLPAGFQAPSLNARVVSSTAGGAAPSEANQSHYYPVVTRAQSAPVSVAPAAPSAEVQAYLQSVMEIHAGNAALNSARGLLPYARVPVAADEQP